MIERTSEKKNERVAIFHYCVPLRCKRSFMCAVPTEICRFIYVVTVYGLASNCRARLLQDHSKITHRFILKFI
jgi:hypothetical protein